MASPIEATENQIPPMESLFIYGSLAPGEPNDRFLKKIPGIWARGYIYGKLINASWKTTGGYPGLRLEDNPGKIEGLLFSSPNFQELWEELDEFEGTELYERVQTQVFLEDQPHPVDAYVYVMK
jgi:gamma-glutamylcyclotransferase (GGCT)/AIG2-like uncharacterized protein YtfP